jgi:nucleoside-diphosphate-sugar epimerase
MNFIIGGNGRLGSALAKTLGMGNTKCLERSVYVDWWREQSDDKISRLFQQLGQPGDRIYVAAALIDPSKSAEDHKRINVDLPINISGAARAGMKIVTFGTVMENLVGDDTTNPYYASKKKLGRFISEFSIQNNHALHLQLHTLYGGGAPTPFMFLGQILKSLKEPAPFKMTSGLQLREYHHLDDDIAAIELLAEEDQSGCMTISHGEPIKLRDLATHLFAGFDQMDLLKVGALVSSSIENFDSEFLRSPLLENLKFRDSLDGCLSYLREHHHTNLN